MLLHLKNHPGIMNDNLAAMQSPGVPYSRERIWDFQVQSIIQNVITPALKNNLPVELRVNTEIVQETGTRPANFDIGTAIEKKR